MADLAGAVVGITSLGIQVCEHLIRYYTDFRSFDDDIDAVVKRIEGLKANLKVLELIKHRVALPTDPNDVVLKQARETSDACEQGLRKLDVMLRRCGQTHIAGNWQDKVKLVRKKLYWPFKKDTLMELQDTVDRLQENLHLAVQMLGMYVIEVTLGNFLVGELTQFAAHIAMLRLHISGSLHRRPAR
jgi:hypothetical protein